jgi:hypothetical protein
MAKQAAEGGEAPKKGSILRKKIHAPRTGAEYDTREARKARGGNAAGLYSNIFNPKAGRVIAFQGFGTAGEMTTFRPFAPFDSHDPSVLAPGRKSCEPGHFSHWQQAFQIAGGATTGAQIPGYAYLPLSENGMFSSVLNINSLNKAQLVLNVTRTSGTENIQVLWDFFEPRRSLAAEISAG